MNIYLLNNGGIFHMSARVLREDLRLYVEDIKYPGETGDVLAHYARPEGDEKLPGVIVIHENRGLNPHTEDVARRVALEGFLAIAPNALSPLGGTPEDVDEARSLMRELDGEETTKNFVAAVEYLKTHPQSTGKVGVTGFSVDREGGSHGLLLGRRNDEPGRRQLPGCASSCPLLWQTALS
jgi:carboxymethylenebutenolidase